MLFNYRAKVAETILEFLAFIAILALAFISFKQEDNLSATLYFFLSLVYIISIRLNLVIISKLKQTKEKKA